MDVQELVSKASRVLHSAGQHDLILGHAAARDERDRGVWIKAAGWALGEVTRDRVHLINRQGLVIAGEGKPHNEYPIHTEIMAARPDVNGVVHTHAPYSIALAAANRELLPISHAATYFVPPAIPRFTRTANLICTSELGAELAFELADASAIFLVNHGIVTVGATLEQATVAAVLLEQAARQQLLTASYGGPAVWSDPEEALAKRQSIHNEAALRGHWDYLVRTMNGVSP